MRGVCLPMLGLAFSNLKTRNAADHLAAILQVSLSTGRGRCTGGAGGGRPPPASRHSGSVSRCQKLGLVASAVSLASAGVAAASVPGSPVGAFSRACQVGLQLCTLTQHTHASRGGSAPH